MADSPWRGDAVSLVEAFRNGERSPAEELKATFAAIDKSELNAFCFLDREAAERDAKNADVSLPFGGVPIGIKELDLVAGWPDTEASMVFKDRLAKTTDTQVNRICRVGGAIRIGQTNASEFGGVNLTRTVLHGATRNPWNRDRTPGGSSGGSASAVAGGLVTLATGGDGGGSIRIPAGFTGLLGLKATFGRVPRGPGAPNGNLTTVIGCLSRSVRDTARWFDVVNGHEPHDPLSLQRTSGWENGLGTISTKDLRVAVVPN
ncbi:MAG: amidase, partial [Actinomycetota bacterium]